tara:strand:+ start:4564 stop:4944 length:381 start_codon:yes stop_codon:yes gene_type:complete
MGKSFKGSFRKVKTMKDFFEIYKTNKTYSIAAEIKVINYKPCFTRDEFNFFEDVYFKDSALYMAWAQKRHEVKNINFLKAIFFINEVPIEEHAYTIPNRPEPSVCWWGHPYIDQLKDKISVKFYGC